ncbi:tail fiber protein [Photorhabdus australis]|uniref:tail fiber protein n=1 Tax=Photorhabdus australis TaxID=286156 RepID=UPI00055DD6FD|nr:tail fiber protein [Photorhabdus australis]
MENKYNLSNAENVRTKSIGSSTDDLKKRFKEGSIPLQTDFSELIDIADIGRKACGQSPEQNGPGKGLKLDDDGTLSVDISNGLINQTNAICVGQGNGIVVSSTNVAVKAGNGISVDTNGVAVKAYNGISVDSDGVRVKAYNGISVDSNGVGVKAYNGIDVTSSGVAVKVSANKGLSVDSTGIAVKVNASKGINVDSSGVAVKVKANGGIKVDANGVAIDPNNVLPKGVIVMFSGSTAPTGWALCDGTNGTPNLINRFILSGTISDIGGKSTKTATGQKDAKSFIVDSKVNLTTAISVTVNNTTLNIDQIPSHKHIQGGGFTYNSGLRYSAELNNTNLSNYRTIYNQSGAAWTKSTDHDHYWPYTSTAGSGKGHNHSASATLPAHTHQVDAISPYYILAFIMKL